MPKIIYVSCFEASPIGHGGNHRTYQLLWELKEYIGDTQVHFVHASPAYDSFQKYQYFNQMVDKVKENADFLFRGMLVSSRKNKKINQFKNIILDPKFHFGYVSSDEFEKLVGDIGSPNVCFVDHPSHSWIIQFCNKKIIPIVMCPHNIESFEIRSLNIKKIWDQYSLENNFSQELNILSDCQERLSISKVEAGLLGGLGISTKYYPYYPVGAIKERLDRIRERRSKEGREEGLLLLVGSASHITTKKSIEWFVKNAQENGMPSGIRLVIVGSGTEAIAEKFGNIKGIEIEGWLEEADLEELFVRAAGVLAPQRTGFGALTRISEMACAGIPLVISKHASYAVDLPPGIIHVEDNWEAWQVKMEELVRSNRIINPIEYQNWYQNQQGVLFSTLSNYID